MVKSWKKVEKHLFDDIIKVKIFLYSETFQKGETITMKNIRKILALLLVFALLLGILPMVTLASPAAGEDGIASDSGIAKNLIAEVYGDISLFSGIPLGNIETWPTPPAVTFPTLSPGQIWTGKSVEYNLSSITNEPDGTVTVRIYIWGAIYESDQLPLSEANPYITITDHIGDFWLDNATPSPPPTTIINDKTLTWEIAQNDILGPEPFVIEYTIYLDEDPWRTNWWYSTEGALMEITFEPSGTNPYYYTREERWTAAFDVVGANWNNGNGMRSATIHDNILDITIVLGSNNSTVANRTAAQDWDIPGRWANVVINGVTYSWHLEWSNTQRPAGSGQYPYIFTIRDFQFDDGTIANLRYEVVLDNPGGSGVILGERVIFSETYFKRNFVENQPNELFDWEHIDSTDRWQLRKRLDVVAKILLQEPEALFGDLHIGKQLTGLFHYDWPFINNNFDFTALLRAETDNTHAWVVLNPLPDEGINVFEFAGFVIDPIWATTVTFSVTNPAQIRGLPKRETYVDNELGYVWDYFIDEFFEFTDHGLVTSTQYLGIFPDILVELPNPKLHIESGETLRVTVKNDFLHGIGYLEIYKMFSGFPENWFDVNNEDIYDIVFYVRIWDVLAENYLLFNAVSYDDPNSNFVGETFWCVGNHEYGLSEAHTGPVIMELPVSVNEPIRLANLWTWGSYEVREVNRIGNESTMDTAWLTFWNSVDRVPFYARDSVQEDLWETYQTVWLESWISDNWAQVEEIVSDEAWHDRPVDEWYWGVIYSDNNAEYILEVGETIRVGVTNRYKFHCGTLVFAKELCDNALAWGITEDTTFTARILTDEFPQRALVFVPSEPDWRVIGFMGLDSAGNPNIAYGYQVLCHVGGPTPPENAMTEIEFSVNSPTRLIEIPSYPFDDILIVYTVQEVFPGGNPTLGFVNSEYIITGDMDFLTTTDGTVTFPHLSTRIVTITNNFVPAVGNLVISKELAGSYGAWDVDENTQFFAGVNRNLLRLEFYNPDVGVYVYALYPNRAAYLGGFVGTPMEIVSFSAGHPAVVIGLTAHTYLIGEHPYEVEELWNSDGAPMPGADVTPFSSEVGDIVQDGYNLFVTITNTFINPNFRVIYHGNGHTGGVVPDDTQPFRNEGDVVTVQDRGMMVRAGYTFIGWNTNQDGTGLWRMPGATFVMPGADVNLYAQWQAVSIPRSGSGPGPNLTPEQTPEPETELGPERNVNDFFTDYHIWFIRGYPDNTIRPDNNITRAEIAMVFFRLLRPEMQNIPAAMSSSSFTDVRGDEWYGLAISVLAHHGIFIGYEDGSFRPNASITRREFAAAVSRFDTKITTDTNSFLDVHAGDWAYDYILSVAAKGWFIGFEGQFRPGDNLTRAELVTVMNRILNRSILPEHLPENILRFPDLPETHWAFADLKEAIHTHDYVRHEEGDGINEKWLQITGHGLYAPYNR